MAKKSMRAAATAGTSVFDQIASGRTVRLDADALDIQATQDTENAKDVKDAQNAKDAQYVKDANKNGEELARLNLKIPAALKEYLTIAAARASIEQRRNVSLMEYLCDVVRADKERHKDE